MFFDIQKKKKLKVFILIACSCIAIYSFSTYKYLRPPNHVDEDLKRIPPPLVNLHSKLEHKMPTVCNKPMVAVTSLTESNLKSIENFTSNVNTKNIPIIIIARDESSLKLLSQLKARIPVHIRCWLEMNFKLDSSRHSYVLSPASSNNCNRTNNGIGTVQNTAYVLALLMGACSIWNFQETNALPTGRKVRSFFSPGEYTSSKLSEFTIFSHETQVANTYGLFNAKHRTYLPGAKHDVLMQARGLPHADISKSAMPTLYATDMLNPASKIRHNFRIGIVQSLQDDFPDFNPDKVYLNLPKLFFQPTVPHVNIHPSQFTPVNDKATLFLRDSLWVLFRPPSISSRMSDIWRGYIAQTILRCTGQIIMVTKPHVVAQIPGTVDEQLFEKDHKKLQVLIERTTAFQCIVSTQSNSTASDCLKQLYQHLFEHDLVTKSDLTHLYQWLQLLKNMNYQFPIIASSLCNVKSKSKENMFLLPPPHHPEKALKDIKFRNKELPEYSQILLVVQINHGSTDVIPAWLAVHQYLVPATVRFYAPGKVECFTFATPFLECNFSQDSPGIFQYDSVVHAMQNYPNHEMYFHAHEDLIFHPLGFESLTRTKEGAVAHPRETHWFCVAPGGKDVLPKSGRYNDGYLAIPIREMHAKNALIPLISNYSKHCPATKRSHFNYTTTSKYGPQETCLFGVDPEYDSFAVPKRFKEEWVTACKIMRKHRIYCEIVVPYLEQCAMGAGTKPTNTIKVTRTYYIPATKEAIERTGYCKDIRKAAADLRKLGSKRIFPQGSDFQSAHPFKLSSQTIKALAARNCFLEPFY